MSALKRNSLQYYLFAAFAILLLAACSSATIASQEQATSTSEIISNKSTESPVSTLANSSGPVELRIWLPPEFSPSRGDLAATILQNQLDSFREENPNVQFEIRLKEESGAGGLLESMQAARTAAPLALPDLVLLSSEVLPKAIESNLLFALDEGLSAPLDEDWYIFGLQSVVNNGKTYGIPLAGDALIIMHRFSALEQIPKTWEESLEEPLSIGFAAADPNAFFSMVHLAYVAAIDGPFSQGTEFSDEQIRDLLGYYFDGEAIGVFPFWLSQFDNQEQSWQSFIEGQTAMVVTWSSRFLSSPDSNLGAGLLPTQDGQGFTLAKTWAWTLIAPEGPRTEFSLKLAEHLSEPEFLAQWTAAAGLIPTRSSSLRAWSPDQRQALVSQIVPVASILPLPEQRVQIGLPLSEVIVALLKQEISLDLAVQTMLNSLSLP